MPTKGRAFTGRKGKDKPGVDTSLEHLYVDKERTCLMCGVVFYSEWAGNRRCGSCRAWYINAVSNGDGTAYVSPFEPEDVSTDMPGEYMIT